MSPKNFPSDIDYKLKILGLRVWDHERNLTWQLHGFTGKKKKILSSNLPLFYSKQWSIRFLNIQFPGLPLTLKFMTSFYRSCTDQIYCVCAQWDIYIHKNCCFWGICMSVHMSCRTGIFGNHQPCCTCREDPGQSGPDSLHSSSKVHGPDSEFCASLCENAKILWKHYFPGWIPSYLLTLMAHLG